MHTNKTIGDSLRDQLGRTWAGLRKGIKLCPPEIWKTASDGMPAPAWLAYHVIVYWERLTRCRKSDIGKGLSPTRLPGKEQALVYLQEVDDRVDAWFARRNDGQFAKPPNSARLGQTLLAGALYFLRHNQHHIAHLQMILRQHGIQAALWR